MEFNNLHPINIDNIHQIKFPEDQYYKEEQEKTQIVLHHTVSGPNINNIISSWTSDAQRIATSFIIDRFGVCHQLFSSKYWAHHIGIKREVFQTLGINDMMIDANLSLNKHSIGIELINWGALTKVGNFMLSCYGNKIDTDVTEYSNLYKGFRYFESYSAPQLNTLGSLLLYLNKKYNIPLAYNAEMFQPSLNAVRGVQGIWSHTSYRSDKSDVHPDTNLIKLLEQIYS